MHIIKELQALLINQYAWHSDKSAVFNHDLVISSGFDALDQVLPQGGWLRAGLVDLHIPGEGVGELSVLLPALAQITQEKRKVVFVAPPYLPYAPSLAHAGLDLSYYMLVKVQSLESRIWSIEQALRSGNCGAVVFWDEGMDAYHLRKLHRAALEGNAIGFAFHHLLPKEIDSSPVPLQLIMRPAPGAKVEIEIHNHFQSLPSTLITLDLPKDNPVLCTPLPPSRGRVGSFPSYRSRPTNTQQHRAVIEPMPYPWQLQGNVA